MSLDLFSSQDPSPAPGRGASRALAPLGLAALLLSSIACAGPEESEPEMAEAPPATAEAEAPAVVDGPGWSYDGDTGPTFWGGLDEENAICDSGLEQSPIDLVATDVAAETYPTFAHQPFPLEIVDKGYTIQVEASDGGSIELDGQTFELAQFHVHAGSEHTIDGEQLPLEFHFVHADGNDLAVVGVLVEEGEAHPAFDPIIANFPAGPGESQTIDTVMVDPAALMPADRTAWRYDGSLTTPPCSEEVHWTVLREPITMSAEQIAAFTDRYPNNYRPVQPIHERTLAVYQP